jgi:pre-mRNA-splicing factor CWC26
VYRDKRGRKLDMLNQMMRQQAIAEGKAVAEEKEAYEWGKGTAQKNQEAAHAEELANIKLEPFARSKDDSKLDQMFKERIHADDPMAKYMLEKKDKKEAKLAKEAVAAGGAPLKPRYKGPAPRPNRFNLLPGYRWDGRDRGTGWEEKVLGQAASKQRSKNAAFEWSVSDM